MRSSSRLASPADVMAALGDAAEDPSAVALRAREWPELQLVRMAFEGTGVRDVPPIGFHAISTFTGSSSILSEERDGHRRPLRLPAGATLIRNAGSGARYAWTAAHHASMTCLDPGVVRRAAEELGVVGAGRVEVADSFEEHDPVCAHLVHALEAEADVGAHAAQPLIIESIATALAGRLLARRDGARAWAMRVRGGLAPGALRRVREYVEESVGRPVSLDDLARVAGVSRFHFARQFRVSTGESPMRYVLRARIERGKARLRDRDVTVSRIATELGFADQSHFTRTFRRLVGTSPRRFADLRADAAD